MRETKEIVAVWQSDYRFLAHRNIASAFGPPFSGLLAAQTSNPKFASKRDANFDTRFRKEGSESESESDRAR